MRRLDFEPSPDLYPFASRWLDLGAEARLHYIDEGEGRPILFLHGNPTWSFLYREIVRGLRGRFRCVAVDYPGFGLSDRPSEYGYTPAEHADVVAGLVRRLDLEDAVVMGQDWGGPIGVAAALAEPERVTGFVFGNTWAWPADALRARAFSALMSSVPLRWAILERNLFVERLMPMGTATGFSEEEMEHYRGVQPAPELRAGVAEFPRQIRAAGGWLAGLERGLSQELGDRPSLLVWGMRDRIFPPATIGRWRRLLDDVRLVELPEAKHFIQEDAPDAIAAAIAERFVS